MASAEQEFAPTSHVRYYSDDDGEDTDDYEEDEVEGESRRDRLQDDYEMVERGDGTGVGCGSCFGLASGRCRSSSGRWGWWMGQVLDPRAKWVQEWNRVFLLVCATGLFVDPLFFYALSVSETYVCLFVDGWFAITVTVLRCMTDALHVWNMWLQLKMAKRCGHSSSPAATARDDGRKGERMATRAVAFRYLEAKKGFFFDLFVILPIPQVSSFP